MLYDEAAIIRSRERRREAALVRALPTVLAGALSKKAAKSVEEYADALTQEVSLKED